MHIKQQFDISIVEFFSSYNLKIKPKYFLKIRNLSLNRITPTVDLLVFVLGQTTGSTTDSTGFNGLPVLTINIR